MTAWTAFPYPGDYAFDPLSVALHWARLHAGDKEPLPQDASLRQAWAWFHNGEFQKAVELGLRLGDAGITVVNKATCVYATYLEEKEQTRRDLYLQVAKRAAAQMQAHPDCANAHYWHAYAWSHYSASMSVAKALAQGLNTKVKTSLEQAIALEPLHADAHMALGVFHAEVIDRVGALIAGMTYGVEKTTGLRFLQAALELNVSSAMRTLEYAHAMLMLEGEKMLANAAQLYQQAAAFRPLDAMERLHVEMARAQRNP